MQYRRLGRTNLMAAEVGIGARTLARLSPEDGAAVIRAGVSAGTNVIEVDTAAPAELAALSLALKGLRPQLVVVGTGDPTKSAVAAALAALGLDYFDCFLAAGPDADLGEAQTLVEAGVARSVGLATNDAAHALAAVLDGHIDVIQIPLNLLELRVPSGVDAVLTAARDGNVGILACAPLGGGRLGTRGAAEVLDRLTFLSDGAPRSIAQAAIAWSLTDPRVGAVVAGPGTAEQALENAGASALAPLDAATRERIATALRLD